MTLFLDRDGVINVRTPGDYVKTLEEFIFEHKAPEAISQLTPYFNRIVVLTNQSGIGKGLMTELQLNSVHSVLLASVRTAGGRIDGIYFCPHRPDAGCACRKPAIGLALQAQADFPEIHFRDSWLVGDSVCDMELARALGARAVLIEGKTEEAARLAEMPLHHRFDTLWDFAQWYAEHYILRTSTS
jgi:histidinol-phosphate phosphatase family protein